MSRQALTTLRDWAGLIASVATVLFITLYPHAPSADDPGVSAYRTAIVDQERADTDGAVTAALFDGDATTGAVSLATHAR